MWLAVFDGASRLIFAPFGCLPPPESKEVVVVLLQKIEVGRVVKYRWWVLILCFDQPDSIVLEIPP
jgi:hypothetical protein